jgi:hypothetical protein
MVSQQFVHGEHMNFVLLEDSVHGIIAADLTFVTGIL